MHNYLLIGDMHVKRDNLEESARIIQWVKQLCAAHNARPVFMGDQYNFFGIAHVESLEFWKKAYDDLPGSISLIGNHDLNMDGSASSMTVHASQTRLVGDGAAPIDEKVWAVGFIRNNEKFTQECLGAYKQGARTILCHAEFNGAQFENGFYSPHGIDLAVFPDDLKFISGHIHKHQVLSVGDKSWNAFYVGTPRMLSRSDIGDIKGCHLMSVSDRGAVSISSFFPTPESVSVPFRQVTLEEGGPGPEMIVNSERVYVDVVGSPEFIKKAVNGLPELVKVRTLPKSEVKKSEIRESDGIPAAFSKFADSYFSGKQMSDQDRAKIMADIYRRCPVLKGASHE